MYQVPARAAGPRVLRLGIQTRRDQSVASVSLEGRLLLDRRGTPAAIRLAALTRRRRHTPPPDRRSARTGDVTALRNRFLAR
jgi:hypothetical protein